MIEGVSLTVSFSLFVPYTTADIIALSTLSFPSGFHHIHPCTYTSFLYSIMHPSRTWYHTARILRFPNFAFFLSISLSICTF
jgi:hypothetical protein